MCHVEYALWLVPSGPEAVALRYLMEFRPRPDRPKNHSIRSRSYPRFDPHITLATFWCPHRPYIFQFLPTGAKTTPVEFESMKVGDDFLDSLSIVAKKSSELMQLRDRVMDHMKENFMRASSPSFPHIPLFYLDESYKGERSLLAKQLRETGRANFTLNCSVDGAGPHFDAMKGFEGTEIWLVDITEGVEDWVVLDRRDLKPRMPKAKVYVTRGEPYFNIFGNEGPEPYQVREMASYMPRWGEPSHFAGMYGPMAPYYPLDPR
ncbi:cyclic phosphodiesterase-like protein-domain-containing protein [Suillus subaureus]|uniref:Cyclic phosphodiesterase-like protein-domain-containing protein n=1 Tax=Suillus subaureus TaxID=48587 RepID=A0A9P7EIV7_9AGAM|nr:cyclic phosphodiesterase-like protein-domain-containing protein [Suillus subaureus]KAG1822426.1 cyclic phosphodiesterase-like protein-domain-containing protein [Suillus subaureus]